MAEKARDYADKGEWRKASFVSPKTGLKLKTITAVPALFIGGGRHHQKHRNVKTDQQTQ